MMSTWPLTCIASTQNQTQLQSKLSDNVSYLSHYEVNFMAATIKYAFSMMMMIRFLQRSKFFQFWYKKPGRIQRFIKWWKVNDELLECHSFNGNIKTNGFFANVHQSFRLFVENVKNWVLYGSKEISFSKNKAEFGLAEKRKNLLKGNVRVWCVELDERKMSNKSLCICATKFILDKNELKTLFKKLLWQKQKTP